MGFSSTLKKLGMLGKLLFSTNDRDAITISAPTLYQGSLQPLEIGATLASSLLNTSEFAFLADSSVAATPPSTGDAATRKRGRSSVVQGTGSIDRTPLPHPLRASPTRASGAPRLPELKMQQGWSGEEFVMLGKDGGSNEKSGIEDVAGDGAAGLRPTLRVVSIQPEQRKGSFGPAPPIPMRSPDRPGMPGSWSP